MRRGLLDRISDFLVDSGFGRVGLGKCREPERRHRDRLLDENGPPYHISGGHVSRHTRAGYLSHPYYPDTSRYFDDFLEPYGYHCGVSGYGEVTSPQNIRLWVGRYRGRKHNDGSEMAEGFYVYANQIDAAEDEAIRLITTDTAPWGYDDDVGKIVLGQAHTGLI